MNTVQIPDDPSASWLAIEERGWGDGLPCIPPTPLRVEEMLEDFDPGTVAAELPPAGAEATYELIAINAVMAGCAPGVLPLLIAAVEAVADPAFNLLAIQTTTNPATEVMIVNGPARAKLGLESAESCLGTGARANLTAGRALRLVLMNIGGAKPKEADRATHGFPGKLGVCFAEAEEASPWPPLHTRAGLPPEESAVTVVAGSGTLNLLDTTDNAEELLGSLGRSLAFPGSNDLLYGGTPLLVVSPEHARILAAAGLSKSDIQGRLFETATLPAGELSASNRDSLLSPFRAPHYGSIDAGTRIHLADSPHDLLIAVAGGPGTHSVYIPTFGESRAVVRAISN
jgi:hypothetical protein